MLYVLFLAAVAAFSIAMVHLPLKRIQFEFVTNLYDLGS